MIMYETTRGKEDRGSVVKQLLDWGIRSMREERQIKNTGGRVMFQSGRTKDGKEEDLSLVLHEGLYTFRVNGLTRYSSRDLKTCVKQARAAGYLDEVEAVEITNGKAAAEKVRKIIEIRRTLKRAGKL